MSDAVEQAGTIAKRRLLQLKVSGEVNQLEGTPGLLRLHPLSVATTWTWWYEVEEQVQVTNVLHFKMGRINKTVVIQGKMGSLPK